MRLPTVEAGSRLKLIEAKLRLQKQELARMPSSNLIVTVFILNVTENGFTPAPTVRFGKKIIIIWVQKTDLLQNKRHHHCHQFNLQVILDTLMVREFSPGWISLDITAAVEEWRKRWFIIWENHNKLAKLRRCASRVRGRSHITSDAAGVRGGKAKADHCWRGGSEKFSINGSYVNKNVDREGNWFRFYHSW